MPQGLVYPVARYDGITGHFNSTGALVTGCRQEVDAYGSEAPVTPTIFELFRKQHDLPPEEAWVIATNKSFGLMGGSKLRDVRRSVLRQRHPAQAAPDRDDQVGGEHRRRARRRGSAGARRADDAGARRRLRRIRLEGLRVGPRRSGAELKATLAKSLLDYFNDPMVPTSGDELTFFMTKEIMNRLAPSLLVVNFWDIDIAHYGAYSLYLEAIRRTDRLVHELWQHAQSLPAYRDRTTLLVVPELGRDGDIAGNGFANHRSGDESCRRVWLVALGAGVPKGAGTERPIRRPTWRRRWRASSASRCRSAKAGRCPSWRSETLTMQFDARLTGEAAALARAARGDARAPAGDVPRLHPDRAAEVGRRCSPPSARYQRALLEHLAGLPRPRRERLFAAGIARIEAEAGCDRLATKATGARSRTKRRRCCANGGC